MIRKYYPYLVGVSYHYFNLISISTITIAEINTAVTIATNFSRLIDLFAITITGAFNEIESVIVMVFITSIVVNSLLY